MAYFVVPENVELEYAVENAVDAFEHITSAQHYADSLKKASGKDYNIFQLKHVSTTKTIEEAYDDDEEE